MDKQCLNSSIDFLFPRDKFSTKMKCTPLVLVKGSFPSYIKEEKKKLVPSSSFSESENKKYNFICSIVELQDWLSGKTLVAHCLFDEENFRSCNNLESKLPTKQTFHIKKNKKEASTFLMTPARILTNNHIDILDFQKQNSSKRLSHNEYYGIIYKWLKKT
tara:strand:- start:42330 stop:42812 length:483 start_codon:yes stop_codon:yes gene_type:complete